MPPAPPLFPLGQVCATRAADALMRAHGIAPADVLHRHQHGDWGAIDAEDACANAAALRHGLRLMSVYPFGEVTLWVITEADRSLTTLLLPEDY